MLEFLVAISFGKMALSTHLLYTAFDTAIECGIGCFVCSSFTMCRTNRRTIFVLTLLFVCVLHAKDKIIFAKRMNGSANAVGITEVQQIYRKCAVSYAIPTCTSIEIHLYLTFPTQPHENEILSNVQY